MLSSELWLAMAALVPAGAQLSKDKLKSAFAAHGTAGISYWQQTAWAGSRDTSLHIVGFCCGRSLSSPEITSSHVTTDNKVRVLKTEPLFHGLD